jgi:fused signal recognition particle receptor
MDAALLREFSAWAMQNPGLLVAAALALGVVALLLGLLAGRGAAPAEAPGAGAEASEPAAAAAARPQPTPEALRPPLPAAPPKPPPVRLGARLRRTHDHLVGRLGALLGARRVDAALLEELEALLLGADLGVRTAESLLDEVRKRASGGDAAAVREVLRAAILERLARVEVAPPEPSARPHVIVVLGVNGSGKTTTIGKLAARYRASGSTVLLGAGDTFRAAAIEQLQTWGERVGCDVVAGRAGGDPSAVAFDTVKAAAARGVDVAIIDTAGRLQTRRPLMEELGKLVRVIGREQDGAPHETLLVLDANTGQNAISQARVFTEVAGVTGLVLTKLDGTAKGGVIVGLADEFGLPIRYVGVGEAVEDLRDFSAREFVDALFEEGAG